MEEKKKLDLVVNYDKAIGSFSIIDYEQQKQAFVDFVNSLEVKPLTNDFDRKKYTANRATLNKLRDKIKTQRIATTKIVESQFKAIEKMLDSKSKEYDSEVKRYDAELEKAKEVVVDEENVVVGTEEPKTYTLLLNGSKTALEQVLEYAKSLGLEGEIK